MIWTLAKSGSTAIASALAELSTLALLQALGAPLVFSYAAVQVVGTTITFTLNKLWVFDARASGRLVAESSRYLVVFAGSFVLNTVLPSLGAYGLHLSPFLAYAIAQVTVWSLWSFPLNRWWVFPATRRDSDPGPEQPFAGVVS